MSTACILHERFDIWGGGEKVATDISDALNAPIFTLSKDPDIAEGYDVREIDGFSSALKLPNALKDLYNMYRWQRVEEAYNYDIVIQTHKNTYWFVPKDNQKVVRYVHSTPRGLYDKFYLNESKIKTVMSTGMRTLFQQTIPYADRWIANSDIVKERIKKYYGVENVSVLYPGVDTHKAHTKEEKNDYVLVLGRVESGKRAGLVCDIADKYNGEIVVAGKGSMDSEVRNSDITYKGWVSEKEKWVLLANAKCLLFLAENEDFGIVPIEAFASGTPVIGVNEGFTKYQVRNQLNGYECSPNVESVVSSLEYFDKYGVDWSAEIMYKYAKQFNTTRFKYEIEEHINQLDTRLNPEFIHD